MLVTYTFDFVLGCNIFSLPESAVNLPIIVFKINTKKDAGREEIRYNGGRQLRPVGGRTDPCSGCDVPRKTDYTTSPLRDLDEDISARAKPWYCMTL